MQELQKQLLEMTLKVHPQAMYPAAMCALADLREVLSVLQLPIETALFSLEKWLRRAHLFFGRANPQDVVSAVGFFIRQYV